MIGFAEFSFFNNFADFERVNLRIFHISVHTFNGSVFFRRTQHFFHFPRISTAQEIILLLAILSYWASLPRITVIFLSRENRQKRHIFSFIPQRKLHTKKNSAGNMFFNFLSWTILASGDPYPIGNICLYKILLFDTFIQRYFPS